MGHPWKHFVTITKHRHLVMRHCFKAGIFWQGLRHDLSKYSPAEFILGARYYVGHYSPNVVERQLYGFSKAWLHHKGRNRHHLEYWTDFNPKVGETVGIEMPMRFFVEMICDRMAASKVYMGADYTDASALGYYQRSRHASIIHPETDRLLAETLQLLADQGEAALFRHLRALLAADRQRRRTQPRLSD